MTASTAGVVSQLDGFRGVGPKIASCATLMSLDRLDAFPVTGGCNRPLPSATCRRCPEGWRRKSRARALTGPQQHRAAEWAREHFGPYAGYAGQYLFHWVEPRKEDAA